MLAACSDEPAPMLPVDLTAGQETLASDRIPCARGQTPLTRNCTVKRRTDDNGVVLTVRHPDGAFRRLRIVADGTGVVAADGAEPAEVTLRADGIEVALGGDRYLLPGLAHAVPGP